MRTQEIEYLSKRCGVSSATIKKMVKLGVRDEDVEELLELKYVLSDPEQKGNWGYINPVSVNTVVEAYKAVERDTDVLEDIIDEAIDRLDRSCSSCYNIALKNALKHYLQVGWIPSIDEIDDCEDEVIEDPFYV